MTAKLRDDNEPTDRELLWEIHQALYGNEKNDQPGLIKKVQKHESYIQADKKIKWTLTGIFAAANAWFWHWMNNKG